MDKDINININIDSLVEELRFNKEEIMILKERNIRMKIKLDKVLEKLKSISYYVLEDEKLEIIEYLESDRL